ncbi:MAG TPA: response regulator transcription factor [Candidatus Dietzia intestinipullorum]|nr:response regulator transcription factor [Candidatus Dietzia intestinipullorum]
MRVLVVDDEPALRESVRRGLVAGGWTVETAPDGETGLDLAGDGDFDVVVLDIMMPRRSGYEVVREMRRREIWTPVLMLTAKDGEYDEADAFDLGADDYLVKPFSFVVLEARLRALVRRGAPERPASFVAGDLEVDPAAREVTRAGEPITVTAREYAVLEYLIRNRNQVVSKIQILRAVWDAAYDGDDNIVEVYIGYLRRKIDAPFGTRSIETLRGQGYRLVDSTRT